MGANPSSQHGSAKELTEAIVEPAELITKFIHHTHSTVIYTGLYDSKGDKSIGATPMRARLIWEINIFDLFNIQL